MKNNMSPAKEQIEENKRLSKLTSFQIYKEITDIEYQKENPDKWVIFRALVDFEIHTSLYFYRFGKIEKIHPKSHFMNKCPKDKELITGEEICLPPTGISRKKAGSICLLRAIQDFYRMFDPKKFRYEYNDDEEKQFISSIVWSIYNTYIREWRIMNGNINKNLHPHFHGREDWVSLDFRSPSRSSIVNFSCKNRNFNSEEYMEIIDNVLELISINVINYKDFNTLINALKFPEENEICILKNCEISTLPKVNTRKKDIKLDEIFLNIISVFLSGVVFVMLFPMFFQEISREILYLNF